MCISRRWRGDIVGEGKVVGAIVIVYLGGGVSWCGDWGDSGDSGDGGGVSGDGGDRGDGGGLCWSLCLRVNR